MRLATIRHSDWVVAPPSGRRMLRTKALLATMCGARGKAKILPKKNNLCRISHTSLFTPLWRYWMSVWQLQQWRWRCVGIPDWMRCMPTTPGDRYCGVILVKAKEYTILRIRATAQICRPIAMDILLRYNKHGKVYTTCTEKARCKTMQYDIPYYTRVKHMPMGNSAVLTTGHWPGPPSCRGPELLSSGNFFNVEFDRKFTAFFRHMDM